MTEPQAADYARDMPTDDLHKLLVEADGGNPAAAEQAYGELLRLVRMFVRAGMGRRLRNHRESADVCQSIARSFVEDHRARAIKFGSDAELVAYLKTVVRTKLAMLARSDGALKRGGEDRPVALDGTPEAAPADESPDPADALRASETLDDIGRRLADDEREIARLRLAGMNWDQIASRIGGDAQSVRKRWSRLMERLNRDDRIT